MRQGSTTTLSPATGGSSVRSLRGWNAAVAVSAAIVVLVILASGIGWIASLESKTTTYSVPGRLTRVDLQLFSGHVQVVGSSSSTVEVKRTDRFSFGHAAREQRSLAGGVLRISSRCPRIVLGSCSASYEVAVPETVAVSVRTTEGDVRLTGFRGAATVQTRSGNIAVDAYCGFDLAARSGSGNLRVAAACAPQRLDLSTGSGNATALVPPGRYRIATTSGDGRQRVAGVIRDRRAPFVIDVHSGTGSATVEGGL